MADRCVLLVIYSYSGQQIHHTISFFVCVLVYASRLLTFLGLSLSIPAMLVFADFLVQFYIQVRFCWIMTSHRAFATALTTSPKWRIREFFVGYKSRKGPAAGTNISVISIAALHRTAGCILGFNWTRRSPARQQNTAPYIKELRF